MAIVQVNPPGLASTAEGYVSSITVRTGGSDSVLTPSTSASTYGQVTVSAAAATRLISNNQQFKLISG